MSYNPLPQPANVVVNTGIGTSPVSIANPFPVTGNVSIANTSGNPSLVKYVDSTNIQLDTNERLRVTPGQQQWWYNPTTDKDGDLRFIESFTGTGATSFFVQNLSSVLITSGISSTGSAIRISRRRHKSRPGVSHLYYSNHSFDGPQNNVLKRRGMFTNYNGIFFELGTDLSLIVRRRLVDGTIAEERVARGSFNQDNLDGSGLSGVDISTYNKTTQITSLVSAASSVGISTTEVVWRVGYGVTNPNAFKLGSKVTVTGITSTSYNGCAMVTGIGATSITLSYSNNPTTGSFVGIATNAVMTQTFWHHYQSIFFDFNGNRSSRIRFGLVLPKGQQIIHIFDVADQFGTAYSNAPSIPVRTEIINTGIPDYTPSLTVAGETFNVEAEAELNPGFGVATNNTPTVFAKGGTAEYPIMGIGLRTGEPYQRGDLQFRRLQMFDLGNINPQNAGVLYWRLVLNPTITTTGITTTYIGKASQMLTYAAGATVTDGITLLGGYASQNAPVDISSDLNFLNMGSNIQYTDSDKLVLVVKQLVGGINDAQIVASIDFNENL